VALNDLYRCNIVYNVFGEECMNTFWYQQTAVASGSSNQALKLAEAMDLLFVGELKALQTDDTEYKRIDVWNYTDGVEFATRDQTSDVGVVTAQTAPSQWCVGMRFDRPGIGWNYPRKRVSGFPNYVYLNNGIDPTIAGAIEGFANGWQQPNRFGSVFLWLVIRPDTTFGLGHPDLIGYGAVGDINNVYDASQNSRRN